MKSLSTTDSRAIIRARGIDASLQPLVRRLVRRFNIEDKAPPNRCKRAAELPSLLAAYGAIHARRGLLDKQAASFGP
ncbi:MAG: hypothetical protein ACLP4V_03385 [Methylocella sp.]